MVTKTVIDMATEMDLTKVSEYLARMFVDVKTKAVVLNDVMAGGYGQMYVEIELLDTITIEIDRLSKGNYNLVYYRKYRKAKNSIFVGTDEYLLALAIFESVKNLLTFRTEPRYLN
jgi:hypothetical protein